MDAPREEVPEIVEVAVLLILDIDEAPAVLPATDGLAVNDDVPLASDHRKGDEGLRCGAVRCRATDGQRVSSRS